MQLGLTLLILAGALAALFVSAARSPSSRAGARLEISVQRLPFSCKHPPAVDLPDCTEFRQELKALQKEIRARGRIDSPVIHLVLRPASGRR